MLDEARLQETAHAKLGRPAAMTIGQGVPAKAACGWLARTSPALSVGMDSRNACSLRPSGTLSNSRRGTTFHFH